MCCFTGPVLSVRKTRIFARALPEGRQLLAYETEFAAARDLAMVLPIPVVPGSGDDAVRFVNLEHLPELFDRFDREIETAFRMEGYGGAPGGAAYRSAPALEVHQVGMFEASYVPTAEDFGRLDPRFRLDADVLDALGERKGYGFVVVKLATDATRAHPSTVLTRVHPIAFTFPSRDPARLFYPTVHVHDGAVHSWADFDHALYSTDARKAAVLAKYGIGGSSAIPREASVAGADPRARSATQWLSGEMPYPMTDKAGTTFADQGDRIFRCDVAGKRRNDDTWIELGSPPDEAAIVESLTREGTESGQPLWYAVQWRGPRSPLGTLRELFSRRRPAEIASVRRAESTAAPLFWVHLRHSQAGRRSRDVPGTRALLFALAPRRPDEDVPRYSPFVHLDSRSAVDAWLADGAAVSTVDLAWIHANLS